MVLGLKVEGQGHRVNAWTISQKTKDLKVFKLGTGNDIGISRKWYSFGVERSKVTVRVDSNTE